MMARFCCFITGLNVIDANVLLGLFLIAVAFMDTGDRA